MKKGQNHGLNGLKDDTDYSTSEKSEAIKSVQSVNPCKSVIQTGYKQTDVGVIPEEWDINSLGSVCDVRDGTHESPRFFNQGIPFITSKNIINGRLDLENISYISEEDAAEFDKRSKVDQYDILMSMIGTIGSAALVDREPNFCIKNVALIKPQKVDPSFLIQLINSPFFQHYLGNNLDGGIQKFIALGTLRQLAIPIPEPSEQRAIAAALSDVDALLAKLDQLIAKKRDLKQAAMQQLLTGQTRLLGFSEGWELKRLGEIGTTYGGLTGKTKADFGTGSAQYIPFLNVIGNVVIDQNNLELVKIAASECQNQARIGDLFFNGSSETPEEIGMCAVLLADFQNVYLNSFCFGFRLREGVNANGLFLAYFFRSGQGRTLLYSLAQGATRYNLSKINFLKLEISLPQPEEQTAIAAVLSDMDAEIAALEARRDKTRALKQGMMQELLTGRIRLV